MKNGSKNKSVAFIFLFSVCVQGGAQVLWRAVASRQIVRVCHCHGHTFQTEKLITTFNTPWLKGSHTKFEAVNIKSVRGVRSYARCGKKQNGTNLHVQLKMADFLWTRRMMSRGFFVRLGMMKVCSKFRLATQN